MRCNPVKKLFSSHAESCADCRKVDSLMDSLLKSHAEVEHKDFLQNHWNESRLTRRVFARIHELEESEAGTWESGVIAVRGWLVAFGTAAILLAALSSKLAINGGSTESADDNSSQVSRAANEDVISSNVISGRESAEDAENAR